MVADVAGELLQVLLGMGPVVLVDPVRTGESPTSTSPCEIDVPVGDVVVVVVGLVGDDHEVGT